MSEEEPVAEATEEPIEETTDEPAQEAADAPTEETEKPSEHEEVLPTTSPLTAESGPTFIFNKIQVRPGKAFDLGFETTSPNYLSSLPVIADKPEQYKPMPYTFRVPTATKLTKLSNVYAKSPPFYLLLDHTLAVVWQVFSRKDYTASLGIAQLQWAVSFLKTIINRQGDHSADIKLCIDAIENLLMDQYAELSHEISKLDQIDQNTRYSNGVFGSQMFMIKQMPFSLNYNEMIQKYPEKLGSEYEAKLKHSTMTQEEIDDELGNIKKVATVDEDKRDTGTKYKAINFLNIIKSEKVDKIREELKKLRSIEDLMKNIDEENFEGYIDENNMSVLYQQ